MMRPPLISTDIADLLSRSLVLLPARGHVDLRLLPATARDVDTLAPKRRIRSLRQIGSICLVSRKLLQLPVGLDDLRRSGVIRRVHDPDPELARPDECVDLVHLPRLLAAWQRRAVLQDGVHAVTPVIATVDPALERRREELLRNRLVALVLDPFAGREDAVLEHARPDLLHRDHVEVAELEQLSGLVVCGLEDLSELVVGHG